MTEREREIQGDLDAAIDRVLDLLEQASTEQIELDPLATIVERMRVRGSELDFADAPPLMRMLLEGMMT